MRFAYVLPVGACAHYRCCTSRDLQSCKITLTMLWPLLCTGEYEALRVLVKKNPDSKDNGKKTIRGHLKGPIAYRKCLGLSKELSDRKLSCCMVILAMSPTRTRKTYMLVDTSAKTTTLVNESLRIYCILVFTLILYILVVCFIFLA